MAATTLLALDGVRRLGPKGVPLVSLPVGAWLIHTDHIFAPVGVVGMALIGLGTAWAVYTSEIATRAVATVSASSAS